ncbi:MAG: 2Fe-2S iron-sulfur cluster-binding protein [Chitinophagaceae bacterium]
MYLINVVFENNWKPDANIKGKEGQSLLEVLLNNEIQLPHDCGGVCSCSTCHIYIKEGNQWLEKIVKREMDFLKKVKNKTENSRLACQCLLVPGGKKIGVIVPEKQRLAKRKLVK